MNYFAHGWRFLDRPYLLAGTAVPDWLNVSDRRCRVRSKHARPLVDDADTRVADLARGICQHHADDGWFHESRAFVELSLQLTVALRDLLAGEEGFRPSFLGHILVELLLDAVLIERRPDRLDEYYRAMAQVDAGVIEAVVNRMAPRRAERLAWFVPLFVSERFLCDYTDDAKLWLRLNQVMRRVGLAHLPEAFLNLLPTARRLVTARADELLQPA